MWSPASLEESRGWQTKRKGVGITLLEKKGEGGHLLEPGSAPHRALWAGDLCDPLPLLLREKEWRKAGIEA